MLQFFHMSTRDISTFSNYYWVLQIVHFNAEGTFAYLHDIKHFQVTFLGHKVSMNMIAVTYSETVEESSGCGLLSFSCYGD